MASKRWKRFAAKAAARGYRAFVAQLGCSPGIVVGIEAKSLAAAKRAVRSLEHKHEVLAFGLQEVTP